MQSELIEALEVAKEIIDYCGGDAWERECTAEARERFYELYEKYCPSEVVKGCNPEPAYCSLCNKHFASKKDFENHARDSKKHQDNVEKQLLKAR